MSHRIAYYRVSTGDQSIQAQRHALGGKFDAEFEDIGISGGTMAADRPGFAKLLERVRKGDTICVYAVDRLGRDALDVQSTVRRLIDAGVTVDIHGLGQIGRGVGEIILAVLAQVADMERHKIRERTEGGRATARASLETTGKTHRGKDSLGRPKAMDGAAVVAWRTENRASIRETARHFDLSEATVKRYWAAARADDPLALPDPKRPPFVATVSPLSEQIALLKAQHEKQGASEAESSADYDPLADI
jgi:putative DNA-invertase from lambdoid prophage Rac